MIARTAARLLEDSVMPSNVPTKPDIEKEVLRLEELFDLASAGGPVGNWCAKVASVD